MTGDRPVGPPDRLGDDEAHLAALLAVLARARAVPHTPLQQWRTRRLAALSTANRRE